MVKVKTLEKVLMDNPNFVPGWKLLPNGHGIEDLPKFGAVVRVVVCDDEGNPKYDQYEIIINPGAVGVPWYKSADEQEERFGLITQIRPVVVLPEIYFNLWNEFVGKLQRNKDGKFEYIQDFLVKLNHYQGTFESMEFPSGYSKITARGVEDSSQTVVAEIKEELGADVKRVKLLGYVNPQSLSTYHIPIYSAEIDYSKGIRPNPEPLENIVRREFLILDEIYFRTRSGKVTNGLTLSAMTLYNAHRRYI